MLEVEFREPGFATNDRARLSRRFMSLEEIEVGLPQRALLSNQRLSQVSGLCILEAANSIRAGEACFDKDNVISAGREYGH